MVSQGSVSHGLYADDGWLFDEYRDAVKYRIPAEEQCVQVTHLQGGRQRGQMERSKNLCGTLLVECCFPVECVTWTHSLLS